MVFSSLPLYLDPPNWNQEQGQHQAVNGNGGEDHSNQTANNNNQRPGSSMTERARLAKAPPPEQALRCPRCDSTNTKFCYFNNYSLTQPRHFCKTCRRYWTRGGALRNVPVGGGCRRNKRSKASSKSSSSSHAAGSTVHVAAVTQSPSAVPVPPHQLPFMASLHSLSDYGAANLGLNFIGMQQPIDHNNHAAHEYQVGNHQHIMPQLPFFGAGLESSLSMFPFEGFSGDQVHQKQQSSSSVKMEENSLARLSLQRQFLSLPGSHHDQYWNGSAAGGGGSNSGWATDLPGSLL